VEISKDGSKKATPCHLLAKLVALFGITLLHLNAGICAGLQQVAGQDGSESDHHHSNGQHPAGGRHITHLHLHPHRCMLILYIDALIEILPM